MLWTLVVETFEAKPYPVVVHTFIGETKQEAFGYYRAHLKTDSFFRGCAEGDFRGMECKNRMKWKRIDGRSFLLSQK